MYIKYIFLCQFVDFFLIPVSVHFPLCICVCHFFNYLSLQWTVWPYKYTFCRRAFSIYREHFGCRWREGSWSISPRKIYKALLFTLLKHFLKVIFFSQFFVAFNGHERQKKYSFRAMQFGFNLFLLMWMMFMIAFNKIFL